MENWESWTYAGSSDYIPNLQKLQIRSCEKLGKVPFESLDSATKEIIIANCDPYDDTFSRYLQGLNGLTRLEVVRGGWFFKSDKLILPCKQLMSLEYLHIESFLDVCIKGGLWYIRNLKDLRIINCFTVVTDSNEESAHEDKQAPTQIDHAIHSLTHLTLHGGPAHVADLENVIPQTPSLRNLRLDGLWGRTSITENWLQHLTSLQELEISRYDVLPSVLSSLSSLKRFTLNYCDQIHSIPPNSLPGNLKELQIYLCSFELEVRCQNPTGDACQPKGFIVEVWRSRKMDEWRKRKLEYGQRKLIEMQLKKESLEIPMSRKEKSLNSSKGDSLYQSDKYWSWGQRMQGGHEWPRKQHMKEQPFMEKEKPSSLNDQPEEDESEEEPLEEWLQQSDKYWSWGQRMQGGHEWPSKQHMKEQPFMEKEQPSSLNDQPEEDESEEEPLEEWLQQSEGDKWLEQPWLYYWVEWKLEKELDRNKEDPSSLMKEREEWLKEEERKFLDENMGKDWPNISHVPYIRVEGKIVQNLYT